MTRTFTAFGICIGLILGACSADRDPDDDVDELLALLHDDPLTGPASTTRAAASEIRQPIDPVPLRRWTFDDCTPERTELFGTGGGAFAYRSVGVTCAPGVLGSAVALAAAEDIVYVPDQPAFTFEGGVTVAGWFRPIASDRTQTLFRKRDKGTSAFALVVHRRHFRFVVNLGAGAVASVTSPDVVRAGGFQHVAASYDGAALRLYVDGREVAVRNVAGAIPPGPGPLLIGNDGSERRFDGVIDEAVFELHALPPEQLLELTCLPVEPTVVVTPAVSAPTPPDEAATFDVAVTNHNPPACRAMELTLNVFNPPPNLTIDPFPLFLRNPPVPSGGTTHFAISAVPFDVLDGETVALPFEIAAEEFAFFFSGSAEVVVSEPTGCHVSKSRELLINDPSVTFDPIRTSPLGLAGDPRVGAWSFKHLVEEFAPTPADAPGLVEAWLRSYTTRQIINGFAVEPRPGMTGFLAAWPRSPDGKLNLDVAPFRLKAIVNRIDMRDLDHGNAGEGSFIFSFVQGGDLSATVIFEYKLPATTEADVVAWAQAFHGLGALPFSEPYNAALQAITDRFVRRGARPESVNASALHAVRSNEFSFGRTFDVTFELRELRLSPATGLLVPSPLDRTPDQSFNSTFSLIDFIADNRDAIIAGTHTVPDQLDGQPFRAGAVLNDDFGRWDTFGFDGEGRRAFALATCNGCHSFDETRTSFQHVETFGFGTAALSPFLRGVTVPDPFTRAPRTFNDLRRRKEDLEAIVCPATPTVSLRRGISRTH